MSGNLTRKQLSALKDAFTTLLALLETDQDPVVQKYCRESERQLLEAFPELTEFKKRLVVTR